MTGRVVRLSGPAHQAAEKLLPWYVSGTLEPDEHALVQDHLEHCALCQHEVQALRDFQEVYAEPQPLPDAEASLRRLRDRLPPQESGAAGSPLWRSLRQWFRGRTAQQWLGWVVAAQLGAIAILGVLLATANEQPSAYRTLGASAPAIHPRGDLVVVFDPRSTEEDVRRILRATGARIVDGPTSTHAYVLEVPAPMQAAALATLRAEPAVTLAERLEGGR